MPVRAFIAIKMPADIQTAIYGETAGLRTKIRASVRWVPAKNMHLTLLFLGDIPSADVDAYARMLAEQTKAAHPFDIRISGIGAFPDKRHPHVIYAGIQAPDDLSTLQRTIASGAESLGYRPEERAYTPHLTLGRVIQNSGTSDAAHIGRALESAQFVMPDIIRVDAVHLLKSELTPDGPVYTSMNTALFRT
ncbi:MAG: RNA 2',3'-cyclic phosphodiesterase [Spirochaetes bacterium]|nr:RNA 2',3'-cyclic phosphodiesterase [Spirochaetota bacterium]